MADKNERPVILIMGMSGSGKSTVSDYLESKGLPVVYLGKLTIDELKKRGLEICEANEKMVREGLRKEYGINAYIKMALPKINLIIEKSPVVIDGLYSWSEYKYLVSKVKRPIIIIAIFTNKDLRYERISNREIRPLSFEDTRKRDFAEIENIEKGGPIAFADFMVLNNGNKGNLLIKIEKLIFQNILNEC